jgi:uncharacterized membrane protein
VVGEVTETRESRTEAHDRGLSPPRWSLAEVLALACILAVAAFVRFHRIGGHSFWLDELFTVQAVNGTGLAGTYELPRDIILDPAPQPSAMRPLHPWWRILRPDLHDIHPPLFYLLTRGWLTLFGYTETGFRSHAAVWSIVAVLMLYLTVRLRNGVVVGLLAAAIMALAQPQIQLAQNARSYPMIEALVLFACLLITVVEKRGPSAARCWTLMLILLAAMLTHYSCIGAVAALSLYALLCLRDRRQRRAVVTAGIAASVAFVLIWGRAAWLQSSGESAREPVRFLDSSVYHVRATLLRFASLPAEFLNEAPPGWKWLAPASLLLLPLSLLQPANRRRDALFWVLLFAGGAVPVLGADLARRSTRLDMTWYSILAAPAVYALLAGITAGLRRPILRYWLPGIAAFSCAIAVPNAYLHGWRPDWRRIGRTAAAYAHDGDLLIVIPTLDFDPMHAPHFTLCATHYAQPLRGPLLVLSASATPELWSKLASYPGIVVITDNASADGLLNHVQPTAMRIFPLEGQVYRLVPPSAWKSEQ